MSAFLWIKEKREISERIDFVLAMRLAQNAPADEFKRQIDEWARKAEINMRWDE